MKTITLYRRDFIKTAEADFFDDVLSSLGVAESIWPDIDHIELSVEDWILQKA
jgi:hypothetical protein